MSTQLPDASEPVGDKEKDLQDDNEYLDDSAWSWMFRGMILSVMVIGSANALSFFYRSQGWGSLLGSRQAHDEAIGCLLYTSPSPRDQRGSRMPSSA